jgi:uncharacterized protein with NRDE domain
LEQIKQFLKILFSRKIFRNYLYDWLIPETDETFEDFVKRMAKPVDEKEKFCLLGYSLAELWYKKSTIKTCRKSSNSRV